MVLRHSSEDTSSSWRTEYNRKNLTSIKKHFSLTICAAHTSPTTLKVNYASKVPELSFGFARKNEGQVSRCCAVS